MLHHPIARDPIKVSTYRPSTRVILLRLAHQRHENVLHYFLGAPAIAGHAQGKAVQRGLMAPIQRRERLLVALGGAPQQNVVPVLLRNTHLPWSGVRAAEAFLRSITIPGGPEKGSRARRPLQRGNHRHVWLDVRRQYGVSESTTKPCSRKGPRHQALLASGGRNILPATRVTSRRGTRRCECAPK